MLGSPPLLHPGAQQGEDHRGRAEEWTFSSALLLMVFPSGGSSA